MTSLCNHKSGTRSGWSTSSRFLGPVRFPPRTIRSNMLLSSTCKTTATAQIRMQASSVPIARPRLTSARCSMLAHDNVYILVFVDRLENVVNWTISEVYKWVHLCLVSKGIILLLTKNQLKLKTTHRVCLGSWEMYWKINQKIDVHFFFLFFYPVKEFLKGS